MSRRQGRASRYRTSGRSRGSGPGAANRGASWRLTRQLPDVAAPPGWGQVVQGLSSQAGLPGALDLRHCPARAARYDAVHCLLVHEPTFARLLAVARRPSSPLPWLLRNAWDGQPLDPIRHPSVRHHVGLVAHMTLEQLWMLMASAMSISRLDAITMTRDAWRLVISVARWAAAPPEPKQTRCGRVSWTKRMPYIFPLPGRISDKCAQQTRSVRRICYMNRLKSKKDIRISY
jgi:hypothetical protein